MQSIAEIYFYSASAHLSAVMAVIVTVCPSRCGVLSTKLDL